MSQVRNNVQKQITKFGAALGALAAKPKQLLLTDGKKKAKNKVKKTPRGGAIQNRDMRSSIALPPTSIGITTRSGGFTHSPFIVAGAGTLCSIRGSTTGGLVCGNGSDTLTSTNRFSLDPAGAGANAANFVCMQSAIRNICLSFCRYRWRKFIVTYVPCVSTSTTGAVVVGFTPEVTMTNSSANQPLEISCFERNFSTPVWSPLTFNALGHDAIDEQWYYCDPSSSLDESNMRQESAGSIFCGFLGTPTDGIIYGYLRVEYAIELEGLANTGLFTASVSEPKTQVPEAVSSSSPSVVSSISGQRQLPDTPEPDYYQVSGVRRYIPTL